MDIFEAVRVELTLDQDREAAERRVGAIAAQWIHANLERPSRFRGMGARARLDLHRMGADVRRGSGEVFDPNPF